MPKTALIATSEFSRGAQALQQALENSGYRVSRSTLEKVAAGANDADIFIDRSLPPYNLPAVKWRGTWWNQPDHVWRAWSKTHTSLTAASYELQHPQTVAFESLTGAARDPKSEYVSERERAAAILDLLGGKVVVKPDRGMMGANLHLADSIDSLIQAASTLGSGVVQRFIPEAATTLRLVCTRNEVIAAFARTAAEGDWRGNVGAGASITPMQISTHAETTRLAISTVRALKLDMAGVDIVNTPAGPVMLEANPSFGVAGLLQLFPDALDRLVDRLNQPECACGAREPHDAWAC